MLFVLSTYPESNVVEANYVITNFGKTVAGGTSIRVTV